MAARGLHVALVERELVGGECSYWACIPSKSLLRPGEAVHAAREAAARAQVDVQAALAWRDFMVSDYSDDGQERWLADHDVDLLRGTGRLAGTGAVEVDGVRHTAQHVVVATLSDPIVPPVPGLPDAYAAATGFIDRHGGKIIVLARFIEGLRQANGVIAGASGMGWRRFLVFNAIDAALWVLVWTSEGYFSGSHIDAIYGDVAHYDTYLVTACGVLLLAYIAQRVVRVRRVRSGTAQ